MWISKKKWEALEKRVADLEGQIQGQRASERFIPEDSNGKHFEMGSSCRAPSDN